MKNQFFIFLFILFSPIVFSQKNDSVHQYRSFHFIYENDFFNATDYYYTQGIRYEFIFPGIKKILIVKLLPRLHKTNDEQFKITLNQECFTPLSIRHSFTMRIF